MQNRRRLFRSILPLIAATFSITAILLTVFGYAGYRSSSIYEYLKHPGRGWRGSTTHANSELGYSPIPGARGSETFPVGPDVPMRYSNLGFRVPVDDTRTPPFARPLVLALGCSFTYGAANPAEDTFPFLVAQGLGGTELNAGACSYGLAQMQILAERLIPKYRPDYVIVQSSAWLWERSVAMFLPTYFSVMPSPYFYDEGADIPKIHPPVFESAIPDMPMDKYRETSSSLADRMHFIFEIGIPLVFHDDFHMAIFHLKRHFIPQPASFSRAKFIGIYRYIDRLVRQAGGQTVILVLGGSNRKQVDMLTAVNHAIVVDGERKLLESLKDKTADAYSRTYCHWRNDRLVDSHPNARAHRLFTQAILDGIAAAMDAAAVGSLDRTFTGPADSKHPKDDL